MRVLIVGVISDTHGLLRPEAVAALAGSKMIIHAGDIGSPDVLARLREVAPVVPVRGNNDRAPWAGSIDERTTVERGGRRIHVLHDLATLDRDPRAAGFDVVIAGHSHRPRIEERDGVLYLNPGSAGPRRFSLPITVARLRLGAERVEAEIVDLNPEPSRPSPPRGRGAAPSATRVPRRATRR